MEFINDMGDEVRYENLAFAFEELEEENIGHQLCGVCGAEDG